MNTLSKSDINFLIDCLKNGKEIPEVYKSAIFPTEQKEYELTYASKAREEDIIADTLAAPLQEVRTFNSDNKFDDGWTNKLIFGDNLMSLKNLYEDPQIKGKVKLIYIDPPFATKQDFMKDEEKAYRDKVVGSKFIEFTRKRMVLAYELLSDTGFLAVHIDQKKGHYIKCILDEIFGEQNFVNEIIWSYRSGGASKKESLPRKHDNIFVYRKTDTAEVNAQIERQYLEKKFIDTKIDEQGRFYSDTLVRDVFEGVITTIQNDGNIKKYNIRPVLNVSVERVGYPTQKPEGLLDLLLTIFSGKNDLVMDFFAGSGTTLAVAEKTKRRWIGIDCGKFAIYTMQKRILNLLNEIGNKGNPLKAKAFTLYNAGLYDWAEVKKLDFGHYRDFVLKLFQVREEKHNVQGIEIDGYIGNENAYLWNHTKEKKAKLDLDFVKSLHNALSGKGGDVFYIIAPTNAFAFYEDEIKHDDTIYKTLRVPQSVITELIKRGGETIKQPTSEQDVNDTIDAVGFDFIQVPEVEAEYKIGKPKNSDLFNKNAKECIIKLKTFKSRTLTKSPEEFENYETLSMVMADYNYDGKVFDLDEVFYADNLKPDFEVRFDCAKMDRQMMVIYLDIYGTRRKRFWV